MSFAVGYVKPVQSNVHDPTALDSVLEALRGTSKGKLLYPEPLISSSLTDFCDLKYVGDLDHIIGHCAFKDEITFTDNYNQELTTPIFYQEEDILSVRYVHNSLKSDWLDGEDFSNYRTAFESPPKSPLISPASNITLPVFEDTVDDCSLSDTLTNKPAKKLQHNIENMLAHMQIDKSTGAVADRVKRYQEAYIAHIAAIHTCTVNELKKCEEKMKREEEQISERNKKEEVEIANVIEQHTNKLLAIKVSEAEQRKVQLLAQIALEAQEEQHQQIQQLQEQEQKQELMKKEKRDELLFGLKESYNQFSSALDQMLKEIKEHGEVELPAETDEELNKTLQQGDEVLKSDATIDDLETTVQKIQHGITVVSHIRDIIVETKKQSTSMPPTPQYQAKPENIHQEKQTSHSLARNNPRAEIITTEAKEHLNKLSEIYQSVANMSNMLVTQDNNMRSQLSRALSILNQFSHDASSNRQKLHQMINLLTGAHCSAGGVQVAVSDSNGPAAMFVKDQLSLKLIALSHDKQVQNQAVYASLMLRLWQVDPILKHICLFRLFKTCPYLVPLLPRREEYSSDEEFYKGLGYRQKDDGALENLSSYLKRMGATGQLYGRLISVQVENSTINISVGWEWLSKLILIPAQSAVTCAVLHGFLSTAGNMLIKVYGQQFHKLLRLITEEFLPLLQEVTVEGGGADLGSLKLLLADYCKTGNIPPPPEGYRPLL